MKPLSKFISTDGTFRVENADRQGALYFPLANEQGCLSSITPDLAGDIKLDQHSFLTLPVAFEDLHLSRAARNFWISPKRKKGPNTPWSVAGRSIWQRADENETATVEAGLLWHKLTQVNKKLGIEATTLNFVPADGGTFEVMQVEIKNISSQPLTFTATSAIPLYGRSADNLRDHRHVTSLLNRIKREKFGISLCPTMTFNERGHLVNRTVYYVLGADDKGAAPSGVFGSVAAFIGEGGDLERPLSLLNGTPAPAKFSDDDQGKEAIGALQFKARTLKKGETASFTLLLGIDRAAVPAETVFRQFTGADNVQKHLQATKEFWAKKISTIQFRTGDDGFNQWIRWVQVQPVLRKIFGNSFLPDFDYGRGGRGWRDLWQDCLALILADPAEVRPDIVHNFGGVRIDGSNATIIGRKLQVADCELQIENPKSEIRNPKWVPEFIADRNNIARTWMDHGVWPFLTTLLYLDQTGDWGLLLEKTSYFRDALLHRGKRAEPGWIPDQDPATRNKLKTKDGRVYQGTIFEHFLVQMLVQFFNVGEHNLIRLEDADWNDGLDMAGERGESAAFTSMYAGNLSKIADLLERLVSKAGWTEVSVAEEIVPLLDRVRGRIDYDSIIDKKKRLEEYFNATAKGVKGTHASIPVQQVINDLREKAEWIKRRINEHEWIQHNGCSWYNGYYDNLGARVEGTGPDGKVRMTLPGQVYPVMAGIAPAERVEQVVEAVNQYLFDKQLGGLRLNTDFGAIQTELGRAFSFAFGEKENGAVFSHMAVMYSSALYQRGFAQEGHRVLASLYLMAKNGGRSRIYPGLPEYFNNQARGRYMYLTGSASWYVLTLLTQAFGARGLGGDLLLAPQLTPEQYDAKGLASVTFMFAGARVTVDCLNPKRVSPEKARIKNVTGRKGAVPFTRLSEREVLVQREELVRQKEWHIQIELEEHA